jgi:hypothetical protein
VSPSCLEHCIPHCGRSSTSNAETSQPELSLADAVHQFDAGDRDRCVMELFEAKHHRDALLDTPMVLLNQVIQVFRRALLRVRRQRAIGFQLAHRAVRRSVAVQCDRLWWVPVVIDRFSKEGLGSCYVTPGSKSEVDCPPHPINGAV